jgi:hypothetical protein
MTMFFTISDARFFVGTAVMINSLRITGNPGDVVVVDTGLTDDQRRRLTAAATVVERPPDLRRQPPAFAKATADLYGSSGIVVAIDSDMIVTRSLGDLVAAAAAGKIVLFPDHEVSRSRRFGEWEAAFALAGPPRKQRYVNAGAFALSLDHWPALFARWRQACGRIPLNEIMRDARSPFWAGDQDALNAVLMSEVAAEAQLVGDERQSVHPDGLRDVVVLDEQRLLCEHLGVAPAFLHFSLAPKAWEWSAWRRMRRDDAYVRLFPRVAFAADVPVRLRREEVPAWLRTGARRSLSLAALDLANRTTGAVRHGNLGPFRLGGIRRGAAALRGGGH